NKGKIVESDGSTVINIYYDRPEMTITFIYYNPVTGEEDHRESFSAVYGHVTSGVINYDHKYRYYDLDKNAENGSIISYFNYFGPNMADDYHIVYNGMKLKEEADKKYTLLYHMQDPDGTWKHESYKKIEYLPGTGRRGSTFHPSDRAYVGYYYWTNSEDEFTTDVSDSNKELFPYAGKEQTIVTADGGNPVNDYDGDGKSWLHIYWKRQAYNLKFYGADNEEVSILNGAPLSYAKESLNNPVRHQSVPEDYIFMGWYLTPDFSEGTELDSDNYIMPMQDMTIYAKWQPQDVTVTVEGNGADSKL
ncbi:hypothetical protein, partial [Howardella ureilytica]